MITNLFLVAVVLLSAMVFAAAWRYLPRPAAGRVTRGLFLWLAYVGLMSYLGGVKGPAGPPLILGPVLVFVGFYLAPSASAGKLATAFPLWFLPAAQTFRIAVELLIHGLWMGGIVPKMVTYEGANVDIFVGLSAPLAAWFVTRGRTGLRAGLVWNVLGLLALANVAARFILTTPGPLNLIHAEVPNRAITTFPYTYIAGLFAPLAVSMHVLSIRGIRAALRATATSPRSY